MWSKYFEIMTNIKYHISVDFSFIKEYVAFQVEELAVMIDFLFVFQRLVTKYVNSYFFSINVYFI